MFDCVLEGEHKDIDAFTVNSNHKLQKSNDERDFRATFDEGAMLVVGVLHDDHSLHDLGIQTQMQCNCAGQFDNEDRKEGREVERL